MSKRIKLTQGQYAIVDDEDFDELNKHKWYAQYAHCIKGYYAVRHIRFKNGKQRQKLIQMHRVIMNAPKGMQVDHKNHNTLDNCKQNLRICNHSQNQHNRKLHKNTSSRYKGVCWNKEMEKWRTSIRVSGESIFLGYFDSEEKAGKVYDKKARELFGEFALTNFEEKDGEKVGCIPESSGNN